MYEIEQRTMKAAILEQSNAPLIIDEVELPETLRHGQVLVEVRYTGICGSQLGEIRAVKGPDKFLPHLLGHEASGKVLQCGPGVKHVKADDHVVLHWRPGAGETGEPPKYTWRGKPLNAGWVTTFNQYAIVSENRVTAIPKTFDLKLAPLFGCALTTGMGVVVNNARIAPGEAVVVFGAGGIGLNVIQGAKLCSAWPIIAVDLFDNRLELARELGATHCLNATRDDVAQAVADICGAADVCIDNTGNTKVMAQAYSLLSRDGRLVLVGVPKAGDELSIPTLPLHFGKSIIGSHGGECEPAKDIPRYIKLYEQGVLDLESYFTKTYALDDINQALDDLRDGRVSGRCLVDNFA
ncbi:zinc-binding dehydrogenase [Pseudodesulfovibrio karagichevae]|uniref:Zinc-binding dehydrogenase n=1 Tax=Pseudodesulfovibrio karagichevae TaxID=3239305 RepID=A0ABV4JZ55_9BACT